MDNYQMNYQKTETLTGASTFSVLMRNVYLWMAGGLAITALSAYLVASSETILYAILTSRVLMWALLIGELALVMFLSARIHKMAFNTAMLMFLGYAVLNGVTLSVIVLAYTLSSIAQTFLITAGTFAGMALLGYTTKTDLSTFGQVMRMLLIGLIIATVVNIFWANSGLMMIINYVGVLIFVGLTAYDTQKIKQMLMVYSEAGINDQTQKLALMGSLSLYLDFINLFLYLLRIFGDRK